MGGDLRPGAFMFQELPKPIVGSLELPEQGGIVLSQGAVRAAGVNSNEFARVIGQPVEAVLRTPRGETQSFHLKVVGISQERTPMVQASLNDRIAMKNWWF